MSRSRRKYGWIIISIVLVGALCLSVGIYALWNHNQAQKREAQRIEEVKQKEDQEYEMFQRLQEELKEESYRKCISAANELHSEYLGKVPKNLSTQERLQYAQGLAQTRDSQKEDCDRRYR